MVTMERATKRDPHRPRPHMKFMITEYKKTNEVLFSKMKLGNYSPVAYQEESESQEKEMTKEFLLVLCSPPADLTYTTQSIEMLVESDDEESNDDGHLGLLDEFKYFIENFVQDQLSLGARMDFQELLLPSWCRVHNAAHSEFECCLYQAAISHINGQVSPMEDS